MCESWNQVYKWIFEASEAIVGINSDNLVFNNKGLLSHGVN